MGEIYDRLRGYIGSGPRHREGFVAISAGDFAELRREMPAQQRFMDRKLAGIGVENLMVNLTAVFPDPRLSDGQVVAVDDIHSYVGGSQGQWPKRAAFSAGGA